LRSPIKNQDGTPAHRLVRVYFGENLMRSFYGNFAKIAAFDFSFLGFQQKCALPNTSEFRAPERKLVWQ
jgi:hypothetical protein